MPLLTLGAYVQRGLQYLLCVSVCLSVTALAATAFVSACNQWHLRLVDFWKSLPFKSYGEKKPLCKLVIARRKSFLRTFWTNETVLVAQPVNRILLQTLATIAARVNDSRIPGSGCRQIAHYVSRILRMRDMFLRVVRRQLLVSHLFYAGCTCS